MTIEDIAKKAGVSIATVSRVINHKGYVKEETRTKIEAVIEESGYHPNAAARQLSGNGGGMIAVIVSGTVMVPFLDTVLTTVQEQADQRGYGILYYNTQENPEKEHRAISQAIEYRVNGILFLSVIHPDDETAKLLGRAEKEQIPVVLMDRDITQEDFDIVYIDNKQAIYDSARLLGEAGHKKIAMITCPEVVRDGKRRIDGFIQYEQEYQLPEREDYLYYGEFSEQSGYDGMKQLLELPDPPTAVITSCSSATLGCIRYLTEKQLIMGEDIGLIGFDDIAILDTIGIQLTVMRRPVSKMAEIAYSLLEERMQDAAVWGRRREVVLQTGLFVNGTEKYNSTGGKKNDF